MNPDLPSQKIDKLDNEIDRIAGKIINILDFSFNGEETKRQMKKYVRAEIHNTLKSEISGLAIELNKFRIFDEEKGIVMEDNSDE